MPRRQRELMTPLKLPNADGSSTQYNLVRLTYITDYPSNRKLIYSCQCGRETVLSGIDELYMGWDSAGDRYETNGVVTGNDYDTLMQQDTAKAVCDQIFKDLETQNVITSGVEKDY